MRVDGIEVIIESDASKAVKQLDALAARIDKISNSIGSIRPGSLSNIGSVANSSQRGVSSLADSFNKLTGNATKANKTMASFSQLAVKFYANCFLAIRGVKKLGSAVNSSMDYIETYNYFNVITDKIGTEFGSAWKENGYSNAQDYAASFKDRLNNLTSQMTGFKIGEEGGLYLSDSIGLGLDSEKLMSFQANVSSITNAVGLIGESSVNTSKALTMLSADLSSLKNQSLESVMNSLQSGLIGQSRALYKYGIDITNNTLQHYALANGIEKSVTEMTQAEKMQLRLLAILDQSKVAYGDMANTISGISNQFRILKQQISNLSRIIGNLFIPMLQKVVPYINGVVVALQRFFEWIGTLMGIDWTKLMDGISDGYTDTGLEALNEDADNVTNALENASKAANKLKRTIHGYDELHVATDNSQDKIPNIGGSGGIDLSNQIADALADYEKVWNEAMSKMQNKAQEIADKISSFFKGIWTAIEPFRAALQNLWDNGLSRLGNFSWTALKDFYDGFLQPLGEWAFGTAGEGLTRLVDVFNAFLEKINWSELNRSLKEFWIAIEPYAEQFGEGLIDFFEDVLGIGGDLINKIPGFLDGITAALNNGDPAKARDWGYALGVFAVGLMALKGIGAIIGGIAAFGNAIVGLSTGLGAIFGSSGIFASIGAKIGAVKVALGGLFGGISIASVAGVVAAVAAVIAILVDLWKTSETFRTSVGAAFVLIGDSLSSAFSKVKEAIGPLWESIKELGSALYDLYEAKWKPAVELIASFAAVLLGIVGSAAIEMIASALSGLATALGGVIDIITGVTEILTGLATLDFSKIQDGFSHIGEGLFGLGEGAQEFFTGWIDDFWNNLWSNFGTPIEEAVTSVQAWWDGTAVPFFQGIPEGLGEVWESVKNFCIDTWNALLDFLGGLPDKVGKIISDIAKWFSDLPGKIGYALGYALGTVTKWAIDLAKYLSQKIPEIIESVRKWFSELPDKIYNAIVSFIEKAKQWAANVKKIFEEKSKEIINNVINFFKELPGKIYDAIKGFFEKIRQWAKEAISTVRSTVPEIISTIVNFFTSLPSKLFDIGKQMIQGLINGVQSMFSSAWSAISSFADGVVKGFKSALQIHSPSRVMFALGEFTIEGYENGLKNLFGDVYSTLGKFSEKIQSSVDVDASVILPNSLDKKYTLNTGEAFAAREAERRSLTTARIGAVSTDGVVGSASSEIRRAVTEAMMDVFMATSGNAGNQNSDRPIQIVLDRRIVAEVTYRELEDMAMRGEIPAII